jgi:hypothetical protein
MSRVLIISKTRMYNGACIGGITIPDLKSVRLLNPDRSYHPADTDFAVGQVWDMELKTAPNLTPPHNEDVLVLSKKFVKKVSAFNDVIDEKGLSKIVWTGNPKNLFEGCLSWTGNRHGFIGKANISEMSTGFWIPDRDLVYNDKYYIYDDGNDNWDSVFGFKYVGFEPPINTIKAGKKVRVSLAKWWHPKDTPDMPDRCYLQLSGWYDT